MFGFGKKKEKKSKEVRREAIIAQAKAMAKAKTVEIGEDTLSEIRNSLLRRENSALEQAKKKIMHMDDDKVRDNLKYWLHDKE